MRRYFLSILMIVAAAALQGCDRTSEKEARFLRDYRTVMELVDNLSEHPPRGFEFETTDRGLPHESFEVMERRIRDSMHSSRGWGVDAVQQAMYCAATAQGGATNAPLNAAMLLKTCFGKLEQAGFTSGEVEFSDITRLSLIDGSLEVASKSWANRDRTLIVLGQIITNRESGRVFASVHYWGTINYRAR